LFVKIRIIYIRDRIKAMRPTMLMFRSPKERTPEYYVPQMTNDGNNLSFGSLSKRIKKSSRVRVSTSFSKQERFADYKYLAKITSKKLGPGTYKDSENFRSLRQKPCPTKIVKSVLGDDSTDPSYMYVGNHLVYEPEYSRSSSTNKEGKRQ
jgi:hypothetical protein